MKAPQVIGTAGNSAEVDALLERVSALEEADQPADALTQAWRALDIASGDLRAKRLVVRLLRHYPQAARAERRKDLAQLLLDPDVGPDELVSAGWNLVLSRPEFSTGDAPVMAAALEDDPLAMRLLSEACVALPNAERMLSAVRRWLLLAGKSPDYPRLARALVEQTKRNGGAWPFDAQERATLDQSPALPFAAAYLCQRPPFVVGGRFSDAVTQAVADQYLRWPYPEWSRVTAPEVSTVPCEIEKLDGGRPSGLPVQSAVLVAGCGTGREAAMFARRFPDAHITAIDISERSLAYAAERCGGLGIDFRMLDLHEVASLGCRFDLIACSGVLHHLPDPESGWAKLVGALNPRGVMKVMVYSRVARLRVEAARAHIADLRGQPVDDDLLREVRRRLIETAPPFVANFFDFYSLNGVHDLLLNRHEDAFDVARIARGLDRLQLELLAFKLPTKRDESRYRREHPDDPMFRDVQAWSALEKSSPFLFSGMYEFWCRAPAPAVRDAAVRR